MANDGFYCCFSGYGKATAERRGMWAYGRFKLKGLVQSQPFMKFRNRHVGLSCDAKHERDIE